MKVIDASVGFKALVTEADSAKAIQLVAPTFAGASAKSLRSLIAGANWRLRLSLRGTRRAAWLTGSSGRSKVSIILALAST